MIKKINYICEININSILDITMALSNISRDHASNLLETLNSQEIQLSSNIKNIKGQHATIAKLEMLYRQMEFVKKEIQQVLEESSITTLLNKATIKCKKCPNTIYHLYKKQDNNEYYLSILDPKQLQDLLKDTFIGSFLLKEDYTWINVL